MVWSKNTKYLCILVKIYPFPYLRKSTGNAAGNYRIALFHGYCTHYKCPEEVWDFTRVNLIHVTCSDSAPFFTLDFIILVDFNSIK